jgi:hypothetical protein
VTKKQIWAFEIPGGRGEGEVITGGAMTYSIGSLALDLGHRFSHCFHLSSLRWCVLALSGVIIVSAALFTVRELFDEMH